MRDMPRSIPSTPLSRILRNCDLISSDCWVWLGTVTPAGYGQISEMTADGQRKRTVHRVAWEQLVGPIPDHLECDHLCFNKRCFNPDHIELVTRRENVTRGSERNSRLQERRKQTHCIHGHELSGYNLIVRKSGGRDCRTCMNESQRRYQQRKREERA